MYELDAAIRESRKRADGFEQILTVARVHCGLLGGLEQRIVKLENNLALCDSLNRRLVAAWETIAARLGRIESLLFDHVPPTSKDTAAAE